MNELPASEGAPIIAFPAMGLTVVTRTEEETRLWGRKLAQLLEGGELVALVGELGTGKTVFVKGMAEGLGVGDEVVSSSFVLVRRYRGRLTLAHVDLYRLERKVEIEELGLGELLDEQSVVVVEWADRAGALEGEERLEVRFEHLPEGRRLTFVPFGERYEEMVRRLEGLAPSGR